MVNDDVQILHSKKTAKINVKNFPVYNDVLGRYESSWTEKQQKSFY